MLNIFSFQTIECVLLMSLCLLRCEIYETRRVGGEIILC